MKGFVQSLRKFQSNSTFAPKMMEAPPPTSDTFVVMSPLTDQCKVIFGKNSSRPLNELQTVDLELNEIPKRTKQCTYIEVEPPSLNAYSVIMSKPAWMWGAEMGANEKNVAIGNEAVWTSHDERDIKVKRLLGQDLVRLGLEYGQTAQEALDVMTSMLERYGQGGPCAENDPEMFYHNSFLIADAKEAWHLETAGSFWVAERIQRGFRNISNKLTLTTRFDRHSTDLHEECKRLGLWNGRGVFNFAAIFDASTILMRQFEGERLLENATRCRDFDVRDMMWILRDEESGILRGFEKDFPTMGSQVSSLGVASSMHFFTGAPVNETFLTFKPFTFNTWHKEVIVSKYYPFPLYKRADFIRKVEAAYNGVRMEGYPNNVAEQFINEQKRITFMQAHESVRLDVMEYIMDACYGDELWAFDIHFPARYEARNQEIIETRAKEQAEAACLEEALWENENNFEKEALSYEIKEHDSEDNETSLDAEEEWNNDKVALLPQDELETRENSKA